jgi:hypothetical protein
LAVSTSFLPFISSFFFSSLFLSLRSAILTNNRKDKKGLSDRI